MQTLQPGIVTSFSWQSMSVCRYTAPFFICSVVVAITTDANYPVLLLLFISNKQIKLITSCVPEDFAQESPTRHQVFRLANAKIHKLSISWIILFANKHLFIWNVADMSSPPFIYILVCVICRCCCTILFSPHASLKVHLILSFYGFIWRTWNYVFITVNNSPTVSWSDSVSPPNLTKLIAGWRCFERVQYLRGSW